MVPVNKDLLTGAVAVNTERKKSQKDVFVNNVFQLDNIVRSGHAERPLRLNKLYKEGLHHCQTSFIRLMC